MYTKTLILYADVSTRNMEIPYNDIYNVLMDHLC